MLELTALWLPVVLSAVLVFVASSILHMVLPFHRGDYDKLPDEDAVLELFRAQEAGAGNYVAPHCVTPEERASEEMRAKLARGPLLFATVIPKIAMGKQLVSWFIFCLVIGGLVAYVASFTVPKDADYMAVFRLTSMVAFLGYAGASASESIWMGRKWSTSLKHIVDGVIYSLLTAGVFGWLAV